MIDSSPAPRLRKATEAFLKSPNHDTALSIQSSQRALKDWRVRNIKTVSPEQGAGK